MNYIVLDLEWNQSYRGKEYSIEEMPFEIIQIGAVKLDEHKNITGRWERIIRPVEYVKLHGKVSEMLEITEDELKMGDDFASAAKEFLEWCGDDYEFITWGSSDLTEFQRNMKHFGVENIFHFHLCIMICRSYTARYTQTARQEEVLRWLLRSLVSARMQSIIQQLMMLYTRQGYSSRWILTA